ncbi:MAG: type II secretion system protein [Candidatus Eremiobacteraeota bacterium]|nr:type II secretion system protein [Candidatus Eremiobacteraeota bacterium]
MGRHKGFTLAEIIVGFALIVIIFLSILTIIPFSNDYINRQKYKQIAINLAREKLESIKDIDYYNIALGEYTPLIDESSGALISAPATAINTDMTEFPPPPYPSENIDGKTYFYSVKVVDRSASQKMLKDITVVVSYWEKTSLQNISLETYIFGIQAP